MVTQTLISWPFALAVAGAAIVGIALCLGIALVRARRLSSQLAQACADLETVCAQSSSPTGDFDKINDSATRILLAIQALRKAVVNG